MVVGDDNVNPQSPSVLHDRVSSNAGIYADNESYSVCGGAVDDFRTHPIPVTHPMRNEKLARGAGQIERLLQDDNRCGAVDIVVTIEKDLLLALDGLSQTGNSAI